MPIETFTRITLGHRPARGAMYGLLACAGIASFFIDLPFLASVVNATFGAIGVFLVVGGLVSAAGHLLRIVVLERAGYPLHITALLALTVVLFLDADDSAARLFFGLLTLAFTLGLYGRGRDLSTLLKYQRELPPEGTDDDK